MPESEENYAKYLEANLQIKDTCLIKICITLYVMKCVGKQLISKLLFLKNINIGNTIVSM